MSWQWLPFDVSGPNGKFALHGDAMHIYLYGTDCPDEWRMHYPDRGKRVSTHVGMINEGYLNHAMQVFTWVRKEHPTVHTFLIGGHSFGGALAQILSAFLTFSGYDVIVSTFGTIRAGRIKQRLLERCTHYIHNGDVAYFWPLWPFYSLPGKRIHFGRWGLPWVVHQPNFYAEVKWQIFGI
jgi:hypothetical protein